VNFAGLLASLLLFELPSLQPRRGFDMFASKTVAEHALRGGIGLSALAACLFVAPEHPWAAVALAPVVLLALRGCPMCWVLGLFQTLSATFEKQPRTPVCQDGRCRLPYPSDPKGRSS
jgi:hypothetical protein